MLYHRLFTNVLNDRNYSNGRRNNTGPCCLYFAVARRKGYQEVPTEAARVSYLIAGRRKSHDRVWPENLILCTVLITADCLQTHARARSLRY